MFYGYVTNIHPIMITNNHRYKLITFYSMFNYYYYFRLKLLIISFVQDAL